MTLKNNKAPLRSHVKLCASFNRHMSIQAGVTVWKRLNSVLTSVTFTFDLWPWSFAWTSLLSLVITPEIFMRIRWWEHSEKGVTDSTDGQKCSQCCLLAAKNTLWTVLYWVWKYHFTCKHCGMPGLLAGLFKYKFAFMLYEIWKLDGPNIKSLW